MDIENPNHTCFYTGQRIDDENLSIDHVIPWSYLFSDDLWNLVYVDRSVNSLKSNHIPDETTIGRLEKRNVQLSKLVEKHCMTDKNIDELNLSISEGLVRKFWIGCLG